MQERAFNYLLGAWASFGDDGVLSLSEECKHFHLKNFPRCTHINKVIKKVVKSGKKTELKVDDCDYIFYDLISGSYDVTLRDHLHGESCLL